VAITLNFLMLNMAVYNGVHASDKGISVKQPVKVKRKSTINILKKFMSCIVETRYCLFQHYILIIHVV
jgi:hypothetical protein